MNQNLNADLKDYYCEKYFSSLICKHLKIILTLYMSISVDSSTLRF